MNVEGQQQVMAAVESTEAVLARKAPWRPKVAGYSALLLGPMAGALVAAASFRRMGQSRKAQQTILYTLFTCTVFMSLFLLGLPDKAPIKPIILMAVEGAGFSIFPSIVRGEYVNWKRENPGVKPRNDYASIGWGLLGFFLYVFLAAIIIMGETIVRLYR